MNYNFINKLGNIKESLYPAAFIFKENNNYVTFYKIGFSEKHAPEVTKCIKNDKELYVTFFFKDCPVPLPKWFCQGIDSCWTKKNMLQNFSVYLRTYANNHSSIFDELIQYRFPKKPIYSANIIRYSLLLRYTSILL